MAWFARLQPEAVAFANGDTYRSLALNVLRMTDALAAAGIAGGQVVGVETPDRYLHLLILIAAEAVSATTISLVPSEFEPPLSLGRLCDRILISRPIQSADPAKTIEMTSGWISNALALPMDERRLDALERQVAPGAIIRLVKSSGTTGIPKVMSMTHEMVQGIIQKNLLDFPARLTRHLDYLCLYNFTVRAVWWRSLLTLQAGGTIHLVGADNLWDMIQSGTGNFVSFVAGDLTRFVQTVPDGSGPFDLQIDVTGGAVSARLRQEVRRKITTHLYVTYSTNEVQRISLVDDDNAGSLFPEVTVQIVDASGQPLPLGRQGVIRVKSDTMSVGYIDAPELTRSAFIDGWYHTNDVGYQPSERTLVVLGRADDMVNAGGVKIPPGPVEERLKAIEGVRDALVTSIAEDLETSVLLVGIETGGDGGAAGLRHLIAQIVAEHTTDFRLILLSEFPRTETMKIRREEVRELYRRTVAGAALC